MKRLICALIATLLTSTLAAATLVPKAAREPGKSQKSAPRILLKQMYAADSKHGSTHPCHIRFVDPYFGHDSNTEYFNRFPTAIYFQCLDARDTNIHNGAATRYDPLSTSWVKDITKMNQYPDMETFNEYPSVAASSVAALENTTHFYALKNINSDGYAFTFDGVVGNSFARTLRYCLLHKTNAMCGEFPVGEANKKPTAGMTLYWITVLRSVEFIDDDIPSVNPTDANPQP